MTATIPEADCAVEQVYDQELENALDDEAVCAGHASRPAVVHASTVCGDQALLCAPCESALREWIAVLEAGGIARCPVHKRFLKAGDITIRPV